MSAPISPPLVRLARRMGWLAALAAAAGRHDLANGYLSALLSHEAFSSRARVWS